MEYPLSQQFFKRGQDVLGVKYPIMCGAMTWVSNPDLVSAICNAGGFGALAAGNSPVEVLDEQIERTKKLTDKPFSVNLITIAPMYPKHIELLLKHRHPYVTFAGSIPREKEIQAIKETGAKVFAFASTLSIATRMIENGVDALILEGMEAGGHIGHVTQVVLLQQVLFEVGHKLPVFIAGGIGTGKLCAHLLLMGAAGVQLGTMFVLAEECCAHKNFKEVFIKAKSRDAVVSPQFDVRLPVVAVRALKNKGMDEFAKLQLDLIEQLNDGKVTRHDAQMKIEEYWVGALRRAVIDGDITHGSLMAGQSVGLVKEIKPLKDIMKALLEDIENELALVKGYFTK